MASKDAPLDGPVRAALAAVPKGADARATLAGVLYHFGTESYRTGADAVLRVALQFADEALKIDPALAGALRQNTRILEEQARRNRLREPGETQAGASGRKPCAFTGATQLPSGVGWQGELRPHAR